MLLCNNCLEIILGNLNKEDIVLMSVLRKEKAVNALFSLSKEKIFELSGDKCNNKNFNNITTRLFLVNLIGVTRKRKKYFITDNGIRLLNIYVNIQGKKPVKKKIESNNNENKSV